MVKMMNDPKENMKETVTGNDASDGMAPKKISASHVNQSFSSDGTVKVQKEPKERAGIILKRAREAKGLSLGIVHEVTKIPMDVLHAIEDGYTVRMLSSFYYKGFLKMYAGYLGVEASEVIEDYKEEELPQHIDPDVEGFEVPQWVGTVFTRQRKQKIVITIGVLLTLFLFFKIIGFFTHRKPRLDVKQDASKTKIVKKKSSKNKVKKLTKKVRKRKRRRAPVKAVAPAVKLKAAQSALVRSIKPASVIPASVVQKSITLTVRAQKNSWLRVKVDGDVVFQSTLRIGAVETWIADDEIEISGKNVNELEFELNGKMIGALGRKNRNAKRVVITKSGLAVKK